MTTATHKPERRQEVRHHAPANYITWAQENESIVHPGWLNDQARSSIAFVTPTDQQPAPGQTLDLTVEAASSSPHHQRVRVVRAAPYDRFFSIIGCLTEADDQ